MIVMGIDLGVSGALAAIDAAGTALIEDLPIVEADDGGKRLDARATIVLLRQLIPAGEAGLLVTEDIRVRQMAGRKMSHATETTLVGLRFALQAVADIARLPLRTVQPQTWKRRYALKADKGGKGVKGDARTIAAGLYPQVAHQLKRVKDHNRAEALLIAHYGRTVLA